MFFARRGESSLSMMHGALALVLALLAPWASSVEPKLQAALSAPTLRNAYIGALVIQADDGSPVFERHADRAFQPASTFKLIVGSTAFARLDPTVRLETKLFARGPIQNGTLFGDLYLRGGGDATLSPADLHDAAMAVRAAGISRIDGNIVADASRYTAAPYPQGWSVDDLPFDYADPVSALSLRDDATNSDAATWHPARSALIAFARSLAHAGVVIHGRLFSHGITPAGVRLVWLHQSAPLPAIIADCWIPSDNLIAELLLEELGVGTAPPETTRGGGIERERAWLTSIGVDVKTVTIADGSGLSQYDRITPRDLVTILDADWHSDERAQIMEALPVAGNSGTLKHQMTTPPLAGNVIAKTGTMMHTRALAGYIRTQRHGTLIFSLLVNNWMNEDTPGAIEELHAAQARFLQALIEG